MSRFLQELQNTLLFSGFTINEIQKILDCLAVQPKHYAKNTIIYQQETLAPQMGLIVTGKVDIIKEDYFSKSNLLARLTPGEIFAETFACLPTLPMDVMVQTAEESELLFFNLQRLFTTCNNTCQYHARIIQNLLFIFAQKNRQLSEKLDCTSPRLIRNRLLAFLSQQARKNHSHQFTISFGRQQLADYLCVDRSAMTTELYKLQKEGIISFQKKQFTIQKKAMQK